MRRSLWLLPIVVAGIGVAVLSACGHYDVWNAASPIQKDELVATGRNSYFILEPGSYLVLEGEGVQLTIAVLSETKIVDGVETRVVVERETRGGQLVDVSRKYFAMNKRTNDVFYFGEDVDMNKEGTVVSPAGAWLSGVDGARAGLVMPGQMTLHARFYQKIVPGVSMDRVEIVSTNETVKTPAGEFTNCVKVKETSPLEPLITEFKYYAPGIGMVQHEKLKLVEFGKAGLRRRLIGV